MSDVEGWYAPVESLFIYAFPGLGSKSGTYELSRLASSYVVERRILAHYTMLDEMIELVKGTPRQLITR
jgi:hypothetical protein